MSKINLEEILINSSAYLNMHGEPILRKEDVLYAMKEACRQTLELAAENVDYHCTDSDVEVIIDKQSILNVINLIE